MTEDVATLPGPTMPSRRRRGFQKFWRTSQRPTPDLFLLLEMGIWHLAFGVRRPCKEPALLRFSALGSVHTLLLSSSRSCSPFFRLFNPLPSSDSTSGISTQTLDDSRAIEQDGCSQRRQGQRHHHEHQRCAGAQDHHPLGPPPQRLDRLRVRLPPAPGRVRRQARAHVSAASFLLQRGTEAHAAVVGLASGAKLGISDP